MPQEKTIEETLNLRLVTAVQADASIESIAALIAQKADVNTLDGDKLPLLYTAINHVNPEMVRVLLDAKAAIKNVKEITVLNYAKTLSIREQNARDALTLIGSLGPQHSNLWPLPGSENERIRRLEEIVAQLNRRPAFLVGLHPSQVNTPLAAMKERPLYDPNLLKTMLRFFDGRAAQKQPRSQAEDISSTASLDEGNSRPREVEEGQKPELKRPAASSSSTDLSAPLSRRKMLLSGGISFASQPGRGDGAVIRDSLSTWALRHNNPQSEIITALLGEGLRQVGLYAAAAAPAAQALADDGIGNVFFDGPD